MSIFKSIYRKISPKNVIGRQQYLISNLKALDPNFVITVESDERVILRLPKTEEGEEIVITLEQHFNSNRSDKGKTLYVKYNSVVENEAINVSLQFEDPTKSFIVIDTLTHAVREETQRMHDKHAQMKKEEKAMQEHIKNTLEERGVSFNEKETQDFYDSLYDGNKDYEITTLTFEQKSALLGAVIYFGASCLTNAQNERTAEIFRDFQRTLQISDEEVVDLIDNKEIWEREYFVNRIKSIHKDGPFIQFIFVCQDLMDLDNYSIAAKASFGSLLLSIGFSEEEKNAAIHGRYTYRFTNTDNNQKINTSTSESKDVQVAYKELIDLFQEHQVDLKISTVSPEKIFLYSCNTATNIEIKITIERNLRNDRSLTVILERIKDSVKLEVEESFDKDEDCKTIFYLISNKFAIEELKCTYSLDDSFMGNTLPKDRLITDLEIMQAMVSYSKKSFIERHTKDLSNSYVSHKVSLPFTEFKRIHGSIKLDSIVNDETGDDYNLCIFTNQVSIIYAGFSPYIVNMSLNEIKSKEEELVMLCDESKGIYLLSTKEYEHYDLGKDISEDWVHCRERSDIERTLIDLNMNKNISNYTFASECK